MAEAAKGERESVKQWVVVAAAVACAAALVSGCKRAATVDSLVAQADQLFQEARYNDAYSLYRRAADLDPKNAHALIRLAECCLWLQDAARGLKWIDRALAVAPHSAPAWEKKGELLLAQGRAKEAIACFEKALDYDGNLNVARLNLSLAYEMLGDTASAVRVAREAVALEPKSAEPHFKLGLALQAAGSLDEAEAEYRRAVALDQKHAAARLRLARLLVGRNKNLVEARKLAQEADRIEPGDGEAAAVAAWALYLSGDKKAAVRELEQVARAHPTNFEVWALFARGLNELGHKEAAR
ncbi:MAG: tetratricopeptide repeat protein, partial [Armatimonadetes bacterium]|nr:tetratricopeptide repeat protein [Armatimonadota bacterium]